jgi:FKBP-type peptidyl-prolyl cis-trans isomerase SlyD
MKISANTVAAIEYTLPNPQGEVLDASEKNDPLEYLHGASNIISGLERELEGLAAGDSKNVTVAPADGYGERDPKLTLQVPRDRFGDSTDIETGMKFHAQLSDGQPHVVTIVAVNGDTVTLDANHELAGVELHFAVKVVSVRQATDEEISHGHPHHEHHCCGGHGHHHHGDGEHDHHGHDHGDGCCGHHHH